MLRSVFGKTLWERRLGMMWWLVATFGFGALLVAFYPAIRDNADYTDFLESFPPELLSLFGIDPAVYQTGFGYLQAQLYSFMAPIILVAFAVGMGAAATAGEEEDGTMDMLLSNPVRRDRLVIEKLAAQAVLLVVLSIALMVVLLVGNVAVDLGLSWSGILGINLGLAVLGLCFGALAALIGSWRGRRSWAAGAAGGLAILAFFVNGLAPLVEGFEWLQKLMPFYWYLADDPLLNGFTAWQLLLLAGAVALAAAAALVFGRRDIGTYLDSKGLLARLPFGGRERRIAPKPSAALRSVFGRTIWQKRRSIWAWIGGLAALGGLTIAFYPTIRDGQPDQLQALIDSVPPEMLALFGITDTEALFTGAGLVSSRLYSSIGLVIMLMFTIGMGAAALAGEEKRGTMDLLLATPVERRRLVGEKYAAMVALVIVISVALFFVVWLGDLAVDLDVTLEGMVAANVGLALIALVFGGLAFTAGAARGRTRVATGVAAGLAVGTFLLNGLGATTEALEWMRPLSPFYWYLGDSPPLAAGFHGTFWLLAAAVVMFFVASRGLFQRRDVGV